MSRYFVLISPTVPAAPYIVAEVVREQGEPSNRSDSIAAGIAGWNATIITGAELGETAGGREALRLWDAGDDTAFDVGTEDDVRSADPEDPGDVAHPAPEPQAGPRRTKRADVRHLRSVP